jgi:hypothetical protein
MYKKILPILVILFLSAAVSAQDVLFNQSALSEKGKQAYSTLSRISVFALGGVGYSGETSKGERALDILIEENAAVPAFKQLIQDGTAEGGLYGVVGLKMLGCECFDQEFLRYKELHFAGGKTEAFTTQFGCIVMSAATPSQKSSTLDDLSTFIFEQAEQKECRRMSNGNPKAIGECLVKAKAAYEK